MAQGKLLEQTLAAASDHESGSLLYPVLLGTAAAGTLDILAAITVWTFRDVAATRVLQSIATGVMGKDAYSGGAGTAALGLLFHYAIMSVIVLIFVLASRRIDLLIRHPLLAGALYGVVVYVVMTYVVVPLSASPLKPPPPPQVFQGLLIHMICVGLPISLTAHRFGRHLLAN